MIKVTSEECSKSVTTSKKLKPIPLQENVSDVLAKNFASLSFADKQSFVADNFSSCTRVNKNVSRNLQRISPSDFVSLQRLRSSALACRTSTANKISRDDTTLIDDLLNNDAVKGNKEKYSRNKSNTKDEELFLSKKTSMQGSSRSNKNEDCDQMELVRGGTSGISNFKSEVLLSRGPVRSMRNTTVGHAPYSAINNNSAAVAHFSTNIENYSLCRRYQHNLENAAVSSVVDITSDLTNFTSSSSTPETVQSDFGYGSSSPQQQISPNLGQNTSCRHEDNTQLPEDLSDFILKYSHEYTTADPSPEGETSVRSRGSSISDGNNQMNYDSPLYRILCEDICLSPLSAKSASQCSPVLPRTSAHIPVIFEESSLNTTSPSINLLNSGPVVINQSRRERLTQRHAKNRLRALIADNEMVEAWAWTCKCIQELKDALCYQDPDGDSLLHIVILHMDLAKVYALVEQMLKSEDAQTRLAFDLPNRVLETPLHLAVQKNSAELVAYLVEAGANPNHQTASPSQQTPLHCASLNGFTEIVEILCSSAKVDVNLQNGMGQTPLLCAVKEHCMDSRKSRLYIDNRRTIMCLLKYGANPMSVDLYGNNILHYAVNSLDADLIEMFKSSVDEETIAKLANKENICGETPLDSLHCEAGTQNERLRTNVFISLLRCGATIKSH
ncbi:unnamed protein product [Thelazia callipaeda]|uniref:ANK_REP_REGION domain-containing protein n=1 Tax=Thelazia callipaeda TaxID=103827 RepID=A0A0N5D7V6_THECL|nr:unnamed protein product [Thelazia callipaeda]